jgi:hypothetical protein
MRTLLIFALVFGCAAQPWKAGVAKAAITPSESIWMAGYGDRNHPSKALRPSRLAISARVRSLGIGQAESGGQVCSENAILGCQVFVSQQQFLIDTTRHKRQNACPAKLIAHGKNPS